MCPKSQIRFNRYRVFLKIPVSIHPASSSSDRPPDSPGFEESSLPGDHMLICLVPGDDSLSRVQCHRHQSPWLRINGIEVVVVILKWEPFFKQYEGWLAMLSITHFLAICRGVLCMECLWRGGCWVRLWEEGES